MTALLAAEGVHKAFGDVIALEDVSVTVDEGELVCLVGPDGAGKTTLVRALTGLVDVDRGVARVGGTPWRDASPEAREGLGYMPQQYGLYTDLSVDENLRFFADLFGLGRRAFAERRAQLLALTRLEAAKDRPAGALSGGMYKKLAVACALLHRPRTLVLDEPTNGVDPVSRAEFWDILLSMKAEGMTIIVSTAYLDEGEKCDAIGLMHKSRLLASAPPGELGAGHATLEDAMVHRIREVDRELIHDTFKR